MTEPHPPGPQPIEDTVASFLLEMPERPTLEQAQHGLQRALGDQTLRLAYWAGDHRGYIDIDGNPFVFPEDERLHVTRVGYVQRPVAALVHDRALLRRRQLLNAVAAIARIALDRDRTHRDLLTTIEELRASRARLALIADRERRRLERNLHDGAQQRLVAVSNFLHVARRRLADDPTQVASLLDTAIQELASAHEDLRELARGIHPVALTNRGLGGAIEGLATRSPLPVSELHVTTEQLPSPVELAAYFVVAEALTNAAKHAQATSAHVNVRSSAGHVEVEVSDDGVGGAAVTEGSGLQGLSDRVQALSGTLRIDSPEGGGTTLTARLPIDAAALAAAPPSTG